jgi:hypothetical protein
VDYNGMMDAAMGYFDEALQLASSGPNFTIPATWDAATVSNAELVKIIHSMKARYMAAVARTPAERAGLDWQTIVNEIDQGVTEDWIQDQDPHKGWYNDAVDYGTYPGWQMMPYWIAGMADQSGNYQTWLNTPLADKQPILNGQDIVIVTPDTRFPQGNTVAAQMKAPGTKFTIPDPSVDDWSITGTWARPERQTWRWSYYWASEYSAYTYWVDFAHPEIRATAQQMLKAEGEYRLGNLQQAADIVNTTRTAAGLNATDASGTNTSCVPKLPDGTCGDLWEMIKWERRMNSRMVGLYDAPWYFDDRGWGDLFANTQLQFPVPCGELQLLDMLPCYSFGGQGGDSSAPVSTYNFPGES